ncbi:MAG TPA: integrase family protein [Bradyrhizobium sp.]|jgi:integrase|nr:integrase family protein [Bradyrhizobium sp.]
MTQSKAAARKARLTELSVRKLKPQPTAYLLWDTLQRGLALRVQPTGTKAWKAIYSFHGRPRWLHLGDANAIGLADARQLAAEAALAVAKGKDPAAEKRAERGAGTFAELATRYLEQHAKRHNKSWAQGDALVRRYAMPRWGKLQAATIARADVRKLIAGIEAPVLANQVLAAVSAIFSWAVKQEVLPTNPCKLVDRNRTKSRERVLSNSEVSVFWHTFDVAGLVVSSALKTILLSGQRPGEIAHMRREHIKDGWWELPGTSDPKLGWPGTKNGATHRVWLPTSVQAVLAELDDTSTGFVFANLRGGPVTTLDAAMRTICAKLGIAEKVTPHDLRRTHGTTVTSMGFGRPAMDRIQNHKEGGIASVYDRHQYEAENKTIMEAVASKIMALVEGEPGGKVVPIVRR